MVTQHVRCAIQAHSDTLQAGARRLDPEVEQRLQALLGDRVVPLLLRCLQLWERGARRTPPPPRAARAVHNRAGLPRSCKQCQPWSAGGTAANAVRRLSVTGAAQGSIAPPQARGGSRTSSRARAPERWAAC